MGLVFFFKLIIENYFNWHIKFENWVLWQLHKVLRRGHICHPSQESGNHCRRGGQRARRLGKELWNATFWAKHSQGGHEVLTSTDDLSYSGFVQEWPNQWGKDGGRTWGSLTFTFKYSLWADSCKWVSSCRCVVTTNPIMYKWVVPIQCHRDNPD